MAERRSQIHYPSTTYSTTPAQTLISHLLPSKIALFTNKNHIVWLKLILKLRYSKINSRYSKFQEFSIWSNFQHMLKRADLLGQRWCHKNDKIVSRNFELNHFIDWNFTNNEHFSLLSTRSALAKVWISKFYENFSLWSTFSVITLFDVISTILFRCLIL